MHGYKKRLPYIHAAISIVRIRYLPLSIVQGQRASLQNFCTPHKLKFVSTNGHASSKTDSRPICGRTRRKGANGGR